MANIRNRETSTEWAATITDPITATKAKERLQYAYDYSSDAINAVMSLLGGTVPPARDLMPEVYDARDKVEAAITSMSALAERAPESHVGHQYVELGKKLGMRLIDESNLAMDRSKKGETPAELVRDVTKIAEHAAENVARGLIKVGGMLLTPMEALLGAALLDEVFNNGRIRKSIIGGGKRRT